MSLRRLAIGLLPALLPVAIVSVGLATTGHPVQIAVSLAALSRDEAGSLDQQVQAAATERPSAGRRATLQLRHRTVAAAVPAPAPQPKVAQPAQLAQPPQLPAAAVEPAKPPVAKAQRLVSPVAPPLVASPAPAVPPLPSAKQDLSGRLLEEAKRILSTTPAAGSRVDVKKTASPKDGDRLVAGPGKGGSKPGDRTGHGPGDSKKGPPPKGGPGGGPGGHGQAPGGPKPPPGGAGSPGMRPGPPAGPPPGPPAGPPPGPPAGPPPGPPPGGPR
jgi:hypothetical protein